MKYLTRFTDEIFSTLISFIFVVEAAQNIGRSFTNPASSFTKGLMTLVVAVSTYVTASTLKGLQRTVYFTKGVRKNVSNFGPTLGVLTGALVARWARLSQGAAAALPSLAIPQTFATTSGRPWRVPLGDLPVWARWGAVLPALMATVLLFLDQNITVRLVNNPSYKMEKGRRKGSMLDGMHAGTFGGGVQRSWQGTYSGDMAALISSASYAKILLAVLQTHWSDIITRNHVDMATSWSQPPHEHSQLMLIDDS